LLKKEVIFKEDLENILSQFITEKEPAAKKRRENPGNPV
jgi:hypothetical protein